ncbi:MAG: nucleotidyltransferase domain-containing protein [Candidatus Hydrothermarchaeales archaeon]
MEVQSRYSKAIDEFVKKVLEKYGNRIEKIILFGSYARGDFEGESDIDVLVVGDITLNDAVDITVPLMLKHGKYISPKVKTSEYLRFLVREGSSFIKNVLEEGVVIYDRMGATPRKGRGEVQVS